MKTLEKLISKYEGQVSPLTPTTNLKNKVEDIPESLKRKLEDDYGSPRSQACQGTVESHDHEISKIRKEDHSRSGSRSSFGSENKKNTCNLKANYSYAGDNGAGPSNSDSRNIASTGSSFENRDVPSDAKDKDDNDLENLKRTVLRLEKKIERMEGQKKKILDDGKVEIGKTGSNVFVTEDQWKAAYNKSCFTAMATSLVPALFPLETLLESNYKGGPSRIDPNAPKRPALDPDIITAILDEVKERHPDFKRGRCGTAINNLLTDLRRKRKAGKC